MAGRMAKTSRLHLSDGVSAKHEHSDPAVRAAQVRVHETSQLLRAASIGDMRKLQRLVDGGSNLTDGVCDRRTPMRLAAADGRVEAVKFLLAHEHPIHVRVRWSSTPLDEARPEGQDAVVEISSAAEKGFSTLTLAADYREVAHATCFVRNFALTYGIDPLVPYRASAVREDVLTTFRQRKRKRSRRAVTEGGT
jgi:hypothetical protein